VVSQTGPRVVRSNFCEGPVNPRKEPKGQTKILWPASVIWNQISDIWPQKGQPDNPVAACGPVVGPEDTYYTQRWAVVSYFNELIFQ